MELSSHNLDDVLIRYEQRVGIIGALKKLMEKQESEQQEDELLLARATEPILKSSITRATIEKVVSDDVPCGFGFNLGDKFFTFSSQKDTLAGAYREIKNYAPEKWLNVIRVLNKLSSKHLEIAEFPGAIFPNRTTPVKSGEWARIDDEHVCYAILDRHAKVKRLRKACRAAELKYGVDLKIIGF